MKYYSLVIIVLTIITATATGVSQQNSYFEIINLQEETYEYTVWDRRGNMIYHDFAYGKEPYIQIVEDNFVQVSISSGTATSTARFFNIDDGSISGLFHSPKAVHNGLVVYMDWDIEKNPVLIVKEIFGDKEWSFYRDFSPVANLGGIIVEAEFISDDAISVIYLIGDEYVETNEVLHLK